MKKLWFLLALISFSGFAQERPALMPWPSEIKQSAGDFRIDTRFDMVLIGPESPDLNKYAARFLSRLVNRVGLYFPNELPKSSGSALFQIVYDQVQPIGLEMDESYSLEILPGSITLNAKSQVGAMRGMETLLQTLDSDGEGFFFRGYQINDTPRFVWRGLLLDVCRHWMPLEVVLRNLDAMAAVKMNVLHLHLTEDQGFRIESKTYPKLHELGSNGNFFTHEDIKKIIEHAQARGIRVIPEFDIPGHATSWFVGYPELASAPGPYQLKTTFGVHDPTMDPTKEETYTFLGSFLAEMANLFPDEFIHIGGDENNGKQWDANPEIRKFKRENGLSSNHELQAYFNVRLAEILEGLGKRMVGWDEILDNDLPEDIVIQSWRGKEALLEAAEAGYDGLLSNGYYIDLVQSTEFHYTNDPIPAGTRISNEARKHILGGEATMWSEIVSPETVDSRIWPRTAAIAERFWSPSLTKDINSMYERLAKVSVQLEEHGLTHIKNYDMLIRRLGGPNNEITIKNLTDYIEPIEGYKRKKPSTRMSLSRLPDIAQPDAFKARIFNLLVAQYLEDPDPIIEREIKDQMLLWVENNKEFKRIAKSHAGLREALPLSADLARASVLGLQALSSTITHDDNWKNNALNTLELAAKPKSECEIRVIEAIEGLVKSAK
jgi:hexosaminidase